MSTLDKRISKLEGDAGTESTVVLLHSWQGHGEYYGVRHGASVIYRQPDEIESNFLDRADRELLVLHRNPPILTCRAIRQSEIGNF